MLEEVILMESLPSDKLKNFQIESLTRDNFESASGVIYIDAPDALENVVQLNRAKLAVATFGGNGVLPNKGAISSTAFTDAPPTGTAIQPAVGEVWMVDLTNINIVNGASGTNNITLQWSDGSETTTIVTAGIAGAATAGVLFDIEKTPEKIAYLTNSLYLTVVGSASDESHLKIPYQMVAQ